MPYYRTNLTSKILGYPQITHLKTLSSQ